MKRAVQAGLLFLYKCVNYTGILSSRAGYALFERAYALYKHAFEAGSVDLLRSFIAPNSTVIDVGANVGFFTMYFGRWVGAGGKVIAIEPEAVNYSALRKAVARAGLDQIVETIQAAAAEEDGVAKLCINPHNPADHWLGDTGVPTPAIAIDNLLRTRGWPPVSLIKIDVQGAEARVLQGSDETIRRFHPTLFIEIDDAALGRAGTTAEKLIAWLTDLGYKIYAPNRAQLSGPLTLIDAEAQRATLGYADFLFLHDSYRLHDTPRR